MDNFKCLMCRKELPHTKEYFYANKMGKNGLDRRCKKCDNKRRDARVVKRFSGLKSGPCTDCARTYPACAMSFDHLPGKEKKSELWQLRKASLDTVREELKNCELVCLNCHAIRTWERRGTSSAHVELEELQKEVTMLKDILGEEQNEVT